MAGKWRLTVDEAFCASHQLRNYNGKCEHLHGHNFG
ncbi:MAG: 6-carboxytetrahydropterin synthase QueD, partial [Desulfovibrio sp.]|nr:6-carboxytetrahydropterin synthase QueD [Desulfovibrio sp.]